MEPEIFTEKIETLLEFYTASYNNYYSYAFTRSRIFSIHGIMDFKVSTKWSVAIIVFIEHPCILQFLKEKSFVERLSKPMYSIAPMTILHFTPETWNGNEDHFHHVCSFLLSEENSGWVRISKEQIINGNWEIPTLKRYIDETGIEIERQEENFLIVSTWDTVSQVQDKIITFIQDTSFDLIQINSLFLGDGAEFPQLSDFGPDDIFFKTIVDSSQNKNGIFDDERCSPIKIYVTKSACYDEILLM